jgi:hypothetical protein
VRKGDLGCGGVEKRGDSRVEEQIVQCAKLKGLRERRRSDVKGR